jgi:hypothetical protein
MQKPFRTQMRKIENMHKKLPARNNYKTKIFNQKVIWFFTLLPDFSLKFKDLPIETVALMHLIALLRCNAVYEISLKI